MSALSISATQNITGENTKTQFISSPQLFTSIENTNTDFQQRLNEIAKLMEQRQNNVGYATGAALRKAWKIFAGEKNKKRIVNSEESISKIEAGKSNNELSIPFSQVYGQMFPQDTLRVIYAELDPGVDDGAALLQLLAVTDDDQTAKKVEIIGIVPCVGNVILPQTEINTRQFLELTKKQNIPVYPGAIAPLAIENDPQAIFEMEKGINDTHFYGYDGEEDVGGWPKVTIPMQKIAGFKFIANQVAQASPDTALTLLSTSSLTELAKTVDEIQFLEQQNGVTSGTYAKNINAISIMGGCLNPIVGCNAPFNATHKNSEANFYFDSPAAQKVFAYCQKFGISILLAPLDLTQQPGLMWTKAENELLRQMNNSVSNQMARVTEVVPHIDAKHFPDGTYPMHDLFSAAAILYPDFFNVMRLAVQIGDVGQIIVDSNASEKSKNVYVLSIPEAKQPNFYRTILKDYGNFNCTVDQRCSNNNGALILWGAFFLACTIVVIARSVFKHFYYGDSSPENAPLYIN